MPYADFNFYQTDFCGNLISSEEEYLASAVKAKCYLDWLTNGQLKNAEVIPEEVKLAECAVSELYHTNSSRQGIHSETNDGYQVVFSEPKETEIYRTAVRYLPSYLVYRGIGI